MTDLEKVIKGLECCRKGFCFACPYNDGVDNNVDCKQKWADDALDLLKAQEPRVITVDEFRRYDGETMWLETKNNELQQLTMEGIAIALMEAEINRWDGCGSYWRCWNKRPTDEQRKEVKWE